MRTTWTFHSTGQLVFGSGAVNQLGELAGQLNLKRLLLVTDVPLCRAGVLDQVRKPLDSVQDTTTGTPPAISTISAYEVQYGAGRITSSPGFTEAMSAL